MMLAAEYAWFWLASLTCFVCYGYVVVHWRRRAGADREILRQAAMLGWYPLGTLHIRSPVLLFIYPLTHSIEPFPSAPDLH